MSEGLGFQINIQTNAAQALDELAQLPVGVDRVAGQVTEALGKLEGLDPFDGVITSASLAGKSIEDLAALARAINPVLSQLQEAEGRIGLIGGSTTGISKTVEGLEQVNGVLQEQLSLLLQIRAVQGGSFTGIPARPLPGEQVSAERAAAEQQFQVLGAARTLGVPASEEAALVAEQQQQQAASAARQAEAERAAASRQSVVDAGENANTVGTAIDPVADLAAIQGAMEEGLVSFRSKTILEVREAFAGINGAIEPGFYNTATGARATGLDDSYLRSTSPFFNGSDSGGGGFASGFKGGFFGGFGGSGGGANDIGQQAGFIAKYVLLYQTFREIEDSIKKSIDLTLNFDRSVTDLSNQLGISRDNATGLANSLAKTGAVAGLNPSESVKLGGQFATTFAGQGSPSDLARQGTSIGAQLHLLVGGGDDSADLRNVTAAVQSFNLTAADTPRVLDAATSAAIHFGLANAGQVLPGLAQIGDLAQQAGFSVEQTANALADITSRTGDTSQAAAGQLQRFLGREGNASFQQVFANEGINTQQPFTQELGELSAKYNSLSDGAKAFITGEFGGGRAGAAALVFLEDYNKIQDEATRSAEQGGIAQEQYFKRLDDVRGVLSQLRGEFDLLLKDIGSSGIGAGAGVLLESLKPVLSTADDLLTVFNQIPAPIREAAFAAAEIAGAIKIISGFSIASSFGFLGGGKAAAGAAAGAATGPELGAGLGVLATETEAGTKEVGSAAFSGATTVGEAMSFLASNIGLSAIEVRDSALAGAASIREAGIAASVQNSLAGVGTSIRAGEANIGPLGLLLGAAIGGIVIDSVAHAASNLESLQSGTASGLTPEQLQSSASRLRTQAANARHQSGGLFGSIENFILDDPAGKTSSKDLSEAAAADQLAKLQQNAINAASATNNLNASLIDLSGTQDAASNSVKDLVANGATATQVVAAIISRFREVDQVSTDPRSIPAGNLDLVASTAGTAARGILAQNPKGQQLGPNTLADVPTTVNAAVLDYLKSQGLTEDQSGTLTEAQTQAEKKVVLASLIKNAESHGATLKQIQQILPDLTLAAGIAVDEQFNAILGKGGSALSETTINQYLAQLQTELSAVSAEAGNKASLSGTPGGGALAGANAGLDDLTKFASTIKNDPALTSKEKTKALAQVQVAIEAQQLAVQSAVLNNITAENAVLEAAVSPFDADGQIQQQISDTQKLLSHTTDATAKKQFGAKLDQLRQQLAQQRVTDANAAADAAVDPRDTTGADVAALDDARRQLALITSSGVTSGAAYSQAVQAVNSALNTLAQQQVGTANAALGASARAGDPLAQARAQLAEAQASLAADLVGTEQYYTDLAAVHEAQSALAQQIATQASNRVLLAGDTTDPVTQAKAALAAAQAQLNEDRTLGTGSLPTDKLAVENAQEAAQKAKFDQRLTDQENAYNLNEESTAQYLSFLDKQHDTLTRQLAGTKKGTEGYRQLTDELTQIDQAIQTVDGQLAGQFNLGTIRTPTVYQVRESLAPGGTLGAAGSQKVSVTIVDKTEQGVKLDASSLSNSSVSRTSITPRKVRR